MRILYVITRAHWGGAQAHVFDLMNHAINKGDECILVVGENGELTERAQKIGIKVYVVPSLIREINICKDIMAIKDLVLIIKKYKPDLLHAHSSKAGIIGRLAAKFTGIPVIFTVHGWAFTEGVSKNKRIIYLWIERLFARLCDKIICVSEYDRQLALKHKVAKKESLITIHNGVSEFDISVSRAPQEKVVIIMVARFSPQKDYKTLLLALKDINSPIEVLLVGEGELLQSSKQLASELNLNEKVKFLGMRKDVKKLLSRSDIFVLVSHYEGLPISIIEAMSAKLPIIASNVGGVSELVEDGFNGFLIKRGDYRDLNNKLNILINNKELREKMGRKSYQKYKDEFTIERMLDKTFKVYDELITKIPV